MSSGVALMILLVLFLFYFLTGRKSLCSLLAGKDFSSMRKEICPCDSLAFFVLHCGDKCQPGD
jgi:hypothetical protein